MTNIPISQPRYESSGRPRPLIGEGGRLVLSQGRAGLARLRHIYNILAFSAIRLSDITKGIGNDHRYPNMVMRSDPEH